MLALKLTSRSNRIAYLKEQLKDQGFIEDPTDTNMEVSPEMAVIIEEIKDAKKTPSLTSEDLSKFVNGDRSYSTFYSTFTKENIMN